MNDSKKMANKRSEVLSAYRQVFSSEPGKVVLYDIIKICGVLKAGYNPDPYATAFNEGLRSCALRILTILRTNPEKFKAHVEDMEKWEEN